MSLVHFIITSGCLYGWVHLLLLTSGWLYMQLVPFIVIYFTAGSPYCYLLYSWFRLLYLLRVGFTAGSSYCIYFTAGSAYFTYFWLALQLVPIIVIYFTVGSLITYFRLALQLVPHSINSSGSANCHLLFIAVSSYNHLLLVAFTTGSAYYHLLLVAFIAGSAYYQLSLTSGCLYNWF